MRELLRRIHYLLNRGRYDQELAEEMAFHREMAAREGGAPFGSALRLREESRESWGWTWIDRLGQDLRYATRTLRRSPGFTAVAVLMLALGIGANVATFGYFNLMVLRPLPIRDPATIRQFLRRSPQNVADNLPYAAVAFYREHCRSLSAVLAQTYARPSIEGEEKPINASLVTANYFAELGGMADLGRTLDPAGDEAPDAEAMVVLSHGFWRRHFGADPQVVGRIVRLDGKPATVVGVASARFSGLGLDAPDLWMPISQKPYLAGVSPRLLTDFGDGGLSVQMWGRLRPGLHPRVAEEELRALAAVLRQDHPQDIWEGESLPSAPGGYATGGMRAHGLYAVLALVAALVLLILGVACANLGSLLIARGLARAQEISVRVALGAGRRRLFRQLFTESLLLAALGSLAGLGLGHAVLRYLMAASEAPAWLDPTPDGRVILFAIGIGFAAAILFGLAPAWQVARQRHRSTLTRPLMIGAQVAASSVLLIVAGLLVRALHRASSVHPGFDYQQVITIDPYLPGDSPANARTYLDALEARLRGVPGIESVAYATNPPLGNRWTVMPAEIAGRTVRVHMNAVAPSFFATMGIPILRGRSLARGDSGSMIVVGDSLARSRWPGEDPTGKTVELGKDPSGARKSHIVVGVAGSARLLSPEDSDAVEVYSLADENILPVVVVLVRTEGPPEALAGVVTAIAKSVDPRRAPQVQVMKSAFAQKVATAANAALAAFVLGSVALLLACLGIVGLVAYAVTQRTRDIGIRMALGAPPAHVLSTVLRQLTRPVLAGLLLGVGGAAAVSQVLRRGLYGVSHLDPIAYLAAIALFLVAVAVAAFLPARRALRVDPMSALRYE